MHAHKKARTFQTAAANAWRTMRLVEKGWLDGLVHLSLWFDDKRKNRHEKYKTWQPCTVVLPIGGVCRWHMHPHTYHRDHSTDAKISLHTWLVFLATSRRALNRTKKKKEVTRTAVKCGLKLSKWKTCSRQCKLSSFNYFMCLTKNKHVTANNFGINHQCTRSSCIEVEHSKNSCTLRKPFCLTIISSDWLHFVSRELGVRNFRIENAVMLIAFVPFATWRYQARGSEVKKKACTIDNYYCVTK